MFGKSIAAEAASPDEAATSQSDRLSWGAILLIYAIGVLGATSISQAIPVAGDMARFYNLGPSQGGWIISMPSAVVALGAISMGWLVDRLGDKRILLIGCAILALGDIGVAFAQSAGVLYAMRIVEGIGYVGISVAAVAMILSCLTFLRHWSGTCSSKGYDLLQIRAFRLPMNSRMPPRSGSKSGLFFSRKTTSERSFSPTATEAAASGASPVLARARSTMAIMSSWLVASKEKGGRKASPSLGVPVGVTVMR